ncbi:hypothetical protein AVEN_31099-1 [Araneus ventricosus]|uniref:Uncharacterized protein n=1 Tax=Araneus ventricosus TaxID=182803 RepID=A0A4Y2KQY3_ARAVE|nr:hypothetical protein AVEN_31099-1 [Araneus ventricosus]
MYIEIERLVQAAVRDIEKRSKSIILSSYISCRRQKFDIAFRKYADFSGCTCPKNKKAPVLERQFLLDQRDPRIGRIGSVDLPASKGMIKRAAQSCKRLRPEISFSESSYSNAVSHSLSNDSQHFGDGVAGVENKAEDNFVKDDMFTKPRGKTSMPELDLTEKWHYCSEIRCKRESCGT